jgi:hypothetical protein
MLETVDVIHNGQTVTIQRGHDRDATLPADVPEDRTRLPALLRPADGGGSGRRHHRRAGGSRLPAADRPRRRFQHPRHRLPHPGLGHARDHPRVGQHPLEHDQLAMPPAPSKHRERPIPSSRSSPTSSAAARQREDHLGLQRRQDPRPLLQRHLVRSVHGQLKTLVKIGYPVHKLKWYRGGMQDWVSVGLTTAKP